MKQEKPFPEPVAGRLIRLLLLSDFLEKENWEGGLQSGDIAAYLGVTAETVRKDINHLTPIGKKQGYRINALKSGIREEILPESIPGIGIVGMGALGNAIREMMEQNNYLNLKVCFDTNMNRMERLDLELPLFPAYEIPQYSRHFNLEILVLCCRPEESWRQAERCVEGGVKQIVNMSGSFLDQNLYDAGIINFNLTAELLRIFSNR